MNIAVATWFRDINYGTVLQALALQCYLKHKGHNPYIINNIPKRDLTIENKLTIFQRLNRKIDYICTNKFLKNNPDLFEKKKKSFFDSVDSKCNLTRGVLTDEDFKNIGREFDMYICGSDQIWNPYWIEPHYFLDFVEKGKTKIAYAPSLGVSKLPQQFHKQYRKWLEDFDGLSVREAETAKQLEGIVHKKVINACDPVFLLSKNQWQELYCKKPLIEGEYVFYYFLSYNRNHMAALKKFAKSKKLKIVGIPVVGRQFYLYGGEKKIDASPADFVNYINFASYVFTDSFHGTSFSVIMEKQFYTFERFPRSSNSSTNSRANNLLKKLDLTNRIIAHNASGFTLQNDIDYESINNKLYEFINQSKAYLDNYLNDNKQNFKEH